MTCSNNLTIVIPCKDDPRVLDCITSIDHACEVLVVINGSSDAFFDAIEPRLIALGARVERLLPANLSAALQHGVIASRHDAILFMDADCLFLPTTITRLLTAMTAGDATGQVFKGRVDFDPGRGWLSRLIARSRHRHTSAPNTAFKPPLLVDRRIAPRIGGYFFDPRLRWKEDADLDWRLRVAGIEVIAVPEASIRHAALGLRDDLRSNFRYGVGAALGELLDIPLTHPKRSLTYTRSHDGTAVAAYMAVANLARAIGYRWTRIRAALVGTHAVPGSAPR